ncbi:MAG: hypothetical protein WCB92_17075, partial [Mycobacterium sp.]
YPLLGSVALPLEEIMRLILNVIWLVFGGLWMALTFIGIPLAPASFKANLKPIPVSLVPLGKEIVPA